MKKVSILIPTYRQPGTIALAVESALAQDYQNLEVVVCDDASADGSLDALAKYADDPRLRVCVNEANLGRVGNYRRSLYERARGDWVLLLDGDDFLCAPDYVTRGMSLVKKDSRLVLVYARIQNLIEGAVECRDSKPIEERDLRILDGDVLLFGLPHATPPLYHATCLYDRHLAMKLDFYRSDILSSDWESIHRLVLCGNVGHIDVVAAVWRRHAGSATGSASFEQLDFNLQCIFGPYQYASSLGRFDHRKLRGWLSAMLYNQARYTLKRVKGAGDRRLAWMYYFKIARSSPMAAVRLLGKPRVLQSLVTGRGSR